MPFGKPNFLTGPDQEELAAVQVKECTCCGLLLPIKRFYPRKPTKKDRSTLRSRCIECELTVGRDTRNPEYHKNWKLKRKFGITLGEYRRLVRRQHGKCAICGRKPEDDSMKHSLAVDHDHRTGKIRGLLCRHCNIGIGKLGDSVEGLQRAIDYLKRSHIDAPDA